MQFACNINRQRIKPSYSGERAICPVCDGELIGKCGEIIVWHWQHSQKSDCDPWKENETEWHRNWKALFPEDWQEVVIENEGQKHRADILTSNGVVIEFQNSAIPSSMIRDRETFYNNMIWVINAESFKSNFKYFSLVKTKLNSLGINWDYGIQQMENQYKEELREMTDELKEIEIKVSNKFSSIEKKQDILENLEDLEGEFENSINKLLAKWDNSESYWSDIYNNLLINWQTENKNIYLKKREQIKNQLSEIEKNRELISEVMSLDEFSFEDIIYKIVPYERISKQAFDRFKAVKRETIHSLLPVIFEIKDEVVFDNYKFSKDKYIFITDPEWIYESRKRLINDLVNKISSEQIELSEFLMKQKTGLKDRIQAEKNELQNQIELIYNEVWSLRAIVNNKEKAISDFRSEKEKEIEDYKNQQYQAEDRIRGDIMKEYKGKYVFSWKHERKSWKGAKKTIYFDIGEDYLFELIYSDQVKKISIEDFMSKYNK